MGHNIINKCNRCHPKACVNTFINYANECLVIIVPELFVIFIFSYYAFFLFKFCFASFFPLDTDERPFGFPSAFPSLIVCHSVSVMASPWCSPPASVQWPSSCTKIFSIASFGCGIGISIGNLVITLRLSADLGRGCAVNWPSWPWARFSPSTSKVDMSGWVTDYFSCA